MYGEVTSRNQRVIVEVTSYITIHNYYINIAAVRSFAISEIIFLRTPAVFS